MLVATKVKLQLQKRCLQLQSQVAACNFCIHKTGCSCRLDVCSDICVLYRCNFLTVAVTSHSLSHFTQSQCIIITKQQGQHRPRLLMSPVSHECVVLFSKATSRHCPPSLYTIANSWCTDCDVLWSEIFMLCALHASSVTVLQKLERNGEEYGGQIDKKREAE